MNTNKIIGVVGVALVLVLAYVYFFTGKETAETTYQTSKVETGTISNTISESGTISSASLVSVSSTTSGIVKEIYVSNGDSVEKDQKLFKVESDATQDEIQTSYSSYLQAKTSFEETQQKESTYLLNIESAENDVSQAQEKVDDKNNNPDDYTNNEKEALELELSNARLKLESAQNTYKGLDNEIAIARAKYISAWTSYDELANGIVKSPVSGVVSNLSIAIGQQVGSSIGSSSTGSTTSSSSAVMMLKQDGDSVVEISVNEIDVSTVAIGQNAIISVSALDDKEYEAEVYSIDNVGTSESGLVLFGVYLKITNADDELKPGMSVTVDIEIEKAEDVLIVKNDYIQSYGGEKYLLEYDRDSNTTKKVNVEVGLVGDSYTEITSGATEDMLIAIENEDDNSSSSSSSSNTSSNFGQMGGMPSM